MTINKLTDNSAFITLELTPECYAALTGDDGKGLKKWVAGAICFDFSYDDTTRPNTVKLLMNDVKLDPVLRSHMTAMQRRIAEIQKNEPLPQGCFSSQPYKIS